MKLRSLLFVPGDSEKKFAKAMQGMADALIFDLEDSVSPAVKPRARKLVADWLDRANPAAASLFVRPNPLDSGLIDEDLAAVVKPGLAGLLIPKANGAWDIAMIASKLDDLERAGGLPSGSVKLIVVATETPLAMFSLGSYTPPHPRLLGMTWGAEDLSSAIGATSNKEADGSWTFPYQVARAHSLFAAAAAGVVPIDTLYTDFRNAAGLETDCRRSRRDGFLGRIAIHPDQVDTINRCFTPSQEEIAHALQIVEAFAAQPELGTIGIAGKMYDIPHLTAARKTLAAADAAT